MALSKTKTVSIVSFENHDNGVTYRYEATSEEGSTPLRIAFTIEKESLLVVRGYQDNLNGLFSFEVLRNASGFDRSLAQQTIDEDLIQVVELLK